MRMARQMGVQEVFVHAFLDGRDTPPNSGSQFLQQLQQQMRAVGVGTIATLSGRYYAMDRDKRWERTEKAYDAMVLGKGLKASDPIGAVPHSYDEGGTDDFLLPTVFTDNRGEPMALIRDEDAVIFFNFRADRARQITRALTDSTLEVPSRSSMPQRLHYVT